MSHLMPVITAVLFLAAVVLWASFAFFLGPRLWTTDRRPTPSALLLQVSSMGGSSSARPRWCGLWRTFHFSLRGERQNGSLWSDFS